MPCDDCLSRRAFLARGSLAVASAAALVSGCGDGQFGPDPLATTTGTVKVKVASLPGLAVTGQLVKIPPQLGLIAVRRTGAATFFAVSTVCTHQGCETNIVSSGLECPCHLSEYDSSGKVTRQPVNTDGSATDLPTYTTAYDAASDTLSIS
jgi:cytochrome b6-f complex iron-sulfur subunit